jgi:hypothetical protein
MDALFDLTTDDVADGGLFAAADVRGPATTLGAARYGAGATAVTYRRHRDGAIVTGDAWSDGPVPDTLWVLCDYDPAGAVIVDTKTFTERPDLRTDGAPTPRT